MKRHAGQTVTPWTTTVWWALWKCSCLLMNPREFCKVHVLCMMSIRECGTVAASDFKETVIEMPWSRYLMKKTTNVTMPLNNLEAQALQNKLNKNNNRIKIKFGSKTHQMDLGWGIKYPMLSLLFCSSDMPPEKKKTITKRYCSCSPVTSASRGYKTNEDETNTKTNMHDAAKQCWAQHTVLSSCKSWVLKFLLHTGRQN